MRRAAELWSCRGEVAVGTVLVALVCIAAPVSAQERPFQLALVAPIQIVPEERGIEGIRINFLYGRNASVTGFDVGVVNRTTRGPSSGVQWGIVSVVDGPFTGWQDNFVTVTRGRLTGFQSGGVNVATSAKGLQWGGVNLAQDMNGLQLGLVNYARRIRGLQIGIVNIISEGGIFPVFPIVNWSF